MGFTSIIAFLSLIIPYFRFTFKSECGLICIAKEKPQEAVVAAVGDGKGYEGKDVQMQVKKGDHVIFSKYAGTEVKVEEEGYIIVSQKDIIAVVE